jgi:putative thiazole-containing bacteriocin maturation protein
MQPRLKSDVTFSLSEEGLLLTDHHGSATVRGAGAYPLLDRLVPFLDGRFTVEEIARSASPDKRPAVRNILNILREGGFVRDLTEAEPHRLSKEVLQTYASQIAYIDALQPSAEARFQRYRETHACLIGSGRLLQGLLPVILRSGVLRTRVVVTRECPIDSSSLARIAEQARQDDPQQRVEFQKFTAPEEASLLSAMEATDVVIHATDRPMLYRALTLDRICREMGRGFIEAAVIGTEAWVGPLVSPVFPAGGWEGAWRRLIAGRRDGLPSKFDLRNQPEAEVSRLLSAPLATMVAGLAAFEIFRAITEVDRAQRHMIRVDLKTAATEAHEYVPHPLAIPCDSPSPDRVVERLAELRNGLTLDEASLLEAAAHHVDPRTGILLSIDEREFVQVPLAVTEVAVSKPAEPRRERVFGVGDDWREARVNAVRRALECYSSIMLDRRRLLDEQARQLIPALDHEEARVDLEEAWLWGWRVEDEAPCLVRANRVFDSAHTGFKRLGVASGFTWAEAVEAALVDAWLGLILMNLEQERQAVPRLDLGETSLNERAARYLRLLEMAGQDVAMYDLSGLVKIPAFAFCTGPSTIAYAAAGEVESALTHGLGLVLLAYQARANAQTAYAPPAVPRFPEDLRDETSIRPEQQSLSPGVVSVLTEELRRRDLKAVVVPLDHDPEVVKLLPYVCRAVLCSDTDVHSLQPKGQL